MARQALNEAFAQTSFLHGSNAAYIEEMKALYEQNPGSVNDEWRLFFQSLNEQPAENLSGSEGPSWGRDLDSLQSFEDADLISALTGDYAGAERHIASRLQQRAHQHGHDLSMAASLRATQDSIRALMLIRAYRAMGHLVADLDPLGLSERTIHNELRPETYGFTDRDLDRPIFIDHVLGLETATVREIVTILQRKYCRKIGVEFLHFSTPAQKAWIQERIEC